MPNGPSKSPLGSASHVVFLAVPPTLTVLAMIATAQATGAARVIFTPLAASAFLVFRAPLDRSNHVGSIVCAHLLGLGLGVGAAAVFVGTSTYLAEASALLAIIAVLIALNVMHAPAVATALLFADAPPTNNHAATFAVNLTVLAALTFVQLYLHRALHPGKADIVGPQ